MNKLKSININGIRGIKDSFSLKLNKKSILIYGDNGTGKSSITDAFEWFFKDSIEHLSGEEIGKKGKNALRNIFLDPDTDANVEIQYSKSDLNNRKSISNALRTTNSNDSEHFYTYFSKSQSENLILRYRDLVQFVIATKGQKLDFLQDIIGFNEVAKMRGLLRKFAGRLGKQIKISDFGNQKSLKQSILLETLEQNITSEKQFFEIIHETVKQLDINKTIVSFEDVEKTLKSIETNEEAAIVEEIGFENRILDTITSVREGINSLSDSYLIFRKSYSSFRKNLDNLKDLQLLALLSEGLNILNKEISEGNSCPLCQQAKDKLALIEELNQRVEGLKEVQNEQNKLSEKQKEVSTLLRNQTNSLSVLVSEKEFGEKANEKRRKTLETVLFKFSEIQREIDKNVLSDDSLRKFDDIKPNPKTIADLIDKAKTKSKSLSDSLKGNLKVQIHTKLSRAKDAFIEHVTLEKKEEILRSQQSTFETLHADFVKRQEKALQGFLDMFSYEINSYYVEMNPNESVDKIKLVPIKDRNDDLAGITIEYSFFDETRTPPVALLSESHVNCLGLSFFLASVKAFNKENKFFVLDDVISSFDGNHRTRFIRMLVNQFSDFQIMLFTHEKDFFDIASSEAKRKGWLINSLSWTAEKGTNLEKTSDNLKETIERKFSDKNTDGLGNDIRKYGERQLKQIAHHIGAKFAFRFNEQNEARMLSELLSETQSSINKNSKSDLKGKNNLDAIQGSPMLIGNKSSHDNTFNENLGDLEVFWEDIKELKETFYCENGSCNTYVSLNFYDTAEKQIRCRCGGLSYDWKK